MDSDDSVNDPYSAGWFLKRGLPSVISPRSRWGGVIGRSAPVLAGWATLMCASLFVMVASDNRDVDVEGDPAPLQWLALIVLFAIVPAVLVMTWAVSRIDSPAVRRIVAGVSIIGGIASDLYQDNVLDAVDNIAVDVAIVGGILLCTGLGLGSIAGWALRITWVHFRSAARLMFRSLPVVLLTILVFFNAPVWTISSNLDGLRTLLLLAFLGAVATSYLIAGLIDSVGPILRRWQDASGLAGGDEDRRPLSRAERANVLLVAAASQVIQALAIAVVVGSLYLVLGLIVLNPANVNHLTGGGPLDSEWLGVSVPVAPAHLRVTAFLMILTYMYICARAVGDGEYRSSFLDPLLADLHTALDARDRLWSGRQGGLVTPGGPATPA